MHLILFKSIIRIINTFFKRKSIKRVINTFTKVLNDRLKLFRVTFRTFWFRVYSSKCNNFNIADEKLQNY